MDNEGDIELNYEGSEEYIEEIDEDEPLSSNTNSASVTSGLSSFIVGKYLNSNISFCFESLLILICR
jgi:hypothetical protein